MSIKHISDFRLYYAHIGRMVILIPEGIMRANPNHADEDQNQSHPNDREYILPAHRLFFLLYFLCHRFTLFSFLPFSPELYPSLYLF